MATTLEMDSVSVVGTGLYHSRLILIGGIGVLYADSALQTWLRLREKRPVKLFVLDVSPEGVFDATLKSTRLPQHLCAEIGAARATDDADAYAALRTLLGECDPSTCPNQIILDLSPREFPRLASACRELASEWFYGRGPRGQSVWPFGRLTAGSPSGAEVPLSDLRACVVNRWFPRRPTAFVVGPRPLRETFTARLIDGEAAFSFVQLADESPHADAWCWTRSPDLVFCAEQSAVAADCRGLWPDAAWVMAGGDGAAAVESGESSSGRARQPIVTVGWSPESPARVTPRWVTQPLAPSAHNLPAAKHYQPTPELEEVRRAWRDDGAQVIGLVGERGCGKTSLVRHFLEQCRATAELSERGEADDRATPTADAVFVWDFAANPHVEKFLACFADYLAPATGGAEHGGGDCLRRIRDGLRERNIRRALLVLDGLDTIQRPAGELDDPLAANLLEEIASARLPLTAIVTTRRATPLESRAGAGYVSARLGKLPVEAACELMRACGLRGGDAQLAALAESFGRHALTISQLGHVLGDCYGGDLGAARRWLGSWGAGAQAGGGETPDGLAPLVERYEELLPAHELAILKCLAAAGEPLTASEFAQVFPRAGGATRHLRPVAGLTPDEVRDGLEVLRGRELVSVHAGHDGAPRYAMHALLSRRFAERLTADAREAISLDLLHYYERQFANVSAGLAGAGGGASPAPVRTRGVTIGPREARRSYPTDTALLDTMEKIIFHTARAGRGQAAGLYYEHQMGGERHLSAIGQDARARRIGGWLGPEARPGN